MTTQSSNVSSNNINIAAHSLGNLVMWDALRLYKHKYTDMAVNNAISIQGAVWSETFDLQLPRDYDSEPDTDHNTTYSINDLMRHSWAFWLQQSNKTAISVVSKFINSFNTNDEALDWMRWANAYPEGHYDRGTPADFRSSGRNSLPEFLALLRYGSRRPKGLLELSSSYKNCLTLPMGMGYNSSTPSVTAHEKVYSPDHGWRNDKHSDLKELPLYTIKNWYKEVFEIKAKIIK